MEAVKIRNRTLIRWLARGAAALFRGLFATFRKQLLFAAPEYSPLIVEPPKTGTLVCLWHDGILGPIFCARPRNSAALVSQHTDGSIVADILDAVDIRPIRGSSSKGGAAAVRQMLSAVDEYHVVIATDGPRGPRRVVKDGIVYLASHSGRPIVPTVFAAAWAWRPRGRWTDLVIPLPFSRVTILSGTPINVPPDLTPSQLGPWRDRLQAAMDDLQSRADRMMLGETVENPTHLDWVQTSQESQLAA
ncbi:MAG: DUF374 domain-containing protein [Planctomycetota bacterium]|nr:MAG: DUF374 domain-containing protein [Planctomycetota bacterium]